MSFSDSSIAQLKEDCKRLGQILEIVRGGDRWW